MSSGTYRIVHYTPDPFSGQRIPIAALVEAQGEIKVARASLLPGADCLGRRAAAVAMDSILESLSDARTLERLPSSTGPYARLDVERPLPPAVRNPVAWVRDNILPRQSDDEDGDAADATPEPRRATEGFALLARLKVANHVHRTFRPRQRWANASEEHLSGLGSVSQYVEGDELLLMEPIVVSRPSFEKDVERISGHFMAYMFALEKLLHDRKTRLVAYVLKGGSEAARQGALRNIRDKAHMTLDMGLDSDQQGLAEFIRKTATSGGGGLFR